MDEGNLKAFEARVPELRIILARRKNGWTLTTLPWEDVEMIILNRLWTKFHMYDPEKGPLENWANSVISRAKSNLLRDHLFKWCRPCVASNPSGGSCAFNQGADRCGFTSNGKQCNLCPLYAKWQKRKEQAFNIQSGLPLDTHSQEVQNLQEDFLDVEAAKCLVDARVMAQLNAHDANIYRMLFIEHMSMEDVGKKLKYKASSNSNISQVLRKLVTRFKQLAREAIKTDDIV